MSYEAKMLKDLRMPARKEVEQAVLVSLFEHNGTIKDFGAGELIVDEIANKFNLNENQRTTFLETIYRKENRVKRSNLWHRLLFRAADALAKEKLVSRPTQTVLLTNKKEWMLTEKGYSSALEILHIPQNQKEALLIKSYEVQKIIKSIYNPQRPENYSPFENKKSKKISQEIKLRSRAFRLAVKEAYDYRCAICGMKIYAPNKLSWEVEAAHIVPHNANGKDDILNGVALCRLHHWAFDVGWFTLDEHFKILVSQKINHLPDNFGKLGDYNFAKQLSEKNQIISLPKEKHLQPHPNAIQWHRENIFIY